MDCGSEFETLDYGRLGAARRCLTCSARREKEWEKAEQKRLATEAAERQAKLVAAARIPLRWKDVTFENSDPAIHGAAFKQCWQYAESFQPKKSKSLYLFSHKFGTGKTHMAACIANYLLHVKHCRVRFQKARDLMLEIRHTYSGMSKEDETMILNSVLSYDLLILDDVGVDSHTGWIESTYWTLFDRRLEQLLPVVVTTNFSLYNPEENESLGDRIGFGAVSRLRQMCRENVIEFKGPDLR